MKNRKFFEKPANYEDAMIALKTKSASYWERLAEKKIIDLANYVISSTPAYKKLLVKNKLKTKVRTLQEFRNLPLVDKNNYLRVSNYSELFPRGYFRQIKTLASTSGSTGEPFYFPRTAEQDDQYEFLAELYLKNQFEIDKKSTLAINGFGMGIWIGGIFTYKVFNRIAEKGYNLTIAPTGRMKDVFLKTFKKMAPYYDQIILMGYPPFIKDVIDEGKDYGIDWKKFKLKFMFATECFSEDFRDYIAEKTGLRNPLRDTLNIYGSVELGTMSHETPLSILIRRIAVANNKVFKGIFPNANVLPTLVQYYPQIVYFEEVGKEVVASGFGSAIPLIRYRFYDLGGVYSFDQMVNKLQSLGIDIYKEAKKAGISDTIFKLPFVYVHERSDFVVNIRGANIYPTNIRKSLENVKLQKMVTGKFQMVKREDKQFNEYLEVNVELKKNIKKSKMAQRRIAKIMVETLKKDNSEFVNMFSSEGDKIGPVVILRPYEDKKYFPSDSIKQRWVSK